MKSLFGSLVPFAAVAAVALGACSHRTDVSTSDTTVMTDTSTVVTHVDTTSTTTMDTIGSNRGVNGSDTSTLGAGIKNASIEKVVEAKLIVKPGFSGVKVESGGNGVIILNGTVGSKAERDAAEQTAKGTDGVKKVENKLTISKAMQSGAK